MDFNEDLNSSPQETFEAQELENANLENQFISDDNDAAVREQLDASEVGDERASAGKKRQDENEKISDSQLQSSTGSESAGGGSASAGGSSAAGSAASAVGGIAAAVAVVAASSMGIAGFSDLGLPTNKELTAVVQFQEDDIGESDAKFQVVVTDNDGRTIYIDIDGNIGGTITRKTFETQETTTVTIDELKPNSQYMVEVSIRDDDGMRIPLVEGATFTTKLSTVSKFDLDQILYSYNRTTKLLTLDLKNCIYDDTGMLYDFSAVVTNGTDTIEHIFVGKPTDPQTIDLTTLTITADMKVFFKFKAPDANEDGEPDNIETGKCDINLDNNQT